MVDLSIMSDVKKCGINSVDVLHILDIGVEMQVTVLVMLLTYQAFLDRGFSGKHVCYYLLRGRALGIREEETL